LLSFFNYTQTTSSIIHQKLTQPIIVDIVDIISSYILWILRERKNNLCGIYVIITFFIFYQASLITNFIIRHNCDWLNIATFWGIMTIE